MNRINRDAYAEGMRRMEQRVFNEVCPSLVEQKKKFEEELLEAFEDIIKAAEAQKKFDWSNIYKFYKVNKEGLTDLYALKIFCSYLFKLFFTYDCPDARLMVKIIHLYQLVQKEYEDLGICNNCRTLGNPKHFFYEEFVETRSILKKVNKGHPDTYAFDKEEFYSKLTADAVYEGDYPFLQFLVKYRLSYPPTDLMNHGKELLKKLSYKYHILKRLEKTEEENALLAEGILERFLASTDNPNLRRLILILRAVNIALRVHVGDTYYPDYVKCLNLYVQTFPEAAISISDMENFLNLAFPDPVDKVILDDVCIAFVKAFPDSTAQPRPRSLKYLCRCKVREYIKNTPTLTTVLSEIDIPIEVKDYMLFMSK